MENDFFIKEIPCECPEDQVGLHRIKNIEYYSDSETSYYVDIEIYYCNLCGEISRIDG